MKIAEALSAINEFKPNGYPEESKIKWLSTVDGMIKKHIIDKYEGAEDIAFSGYDKTTPASTELLVPSPYAEELYLHYLAAKIYFADEEYDKYNVSITQFNSVYEEYSREYGKSHKAITTKIKYF